MSAHAEALASIQRVKVEQRIANQRKGFEFIAASVEKAGLWKAAREIRKEAALVVARMEEMAAEYAAFQAERDAVNHEQVSQ